MIDDANVPRDTSGQSMMDELLRAGVPEIKLALGDLIDRENARPLPPKYARLMPESVLLVTLREDAATALEAIAANLERELTDSCNRHGSLYDRAYRVRLQRSGDPDAPLYSVSAVAGAEGGPKAEPEPGASSESPAPVAAPAATRSPGPPIPVADPDATRAGLEEPIGWQPGRWVLVVEDDAGGEREVFRLTDARVTVGRGSDDPRHRSTIAISDAPHVSRRQLALVWEERDGAAGFKVFNLGLNEVHLPGQSIPGANAGKGPLDLDSVGEAHAGWLPPGVPLRIGDHGPTMRVEEVPQENEEVWKDPDATVFE